MPSSRWRSSRSTAALLMRAGACRSTLILALAAVAVTSSQSPRFFGVATILATYSALWCAIAFVSTLRHLTFRQGSGLVPEMRPRATLAAMGMALVVALLPVGAALLLGKYSLSMTSLVLAAFAVGWWLGPLVPASQKASMMALLGGGVLVLNVGVYANSLSESQRGSEWNWPTLIDPTYLQFLLLVAGIIALWFALKRLASLHEDALILRIWWTRQRGDCDDAAGMVGLPVAALELLPSFALRSLPRRNSGGTDENRLQQSLFRYSQLALSPAGLALIYMPFVLLFTIIGIRGDYDTKAMFWNPNLFLLNSIVVFFGTFKPGRMRRELLRPASRIELVARLSAALRTDVIQFAGIFVCAILALHLLFIREHMDTVIYWSGFLISPGLLAFAYGVAMAGSRLTRWSGLIGFVPAWVFVMFAVERIEEVNSTDEAALWIGASVVLGLLGLGVSRLGQRSWRRADLV